MKTFNKQSGVGLLEILLALVVMSVMTITAFRYYMVASESRRISNALHTIDTVLEASGKWSTLGKPASELSIQTLVSEGLLANQYSQAQSTLWSSILTVSWNGQLVTLTLAPISTTGCTRLRIKLQHIAQLKVSHASCNANKLTVMFPLY